MTSPDVPPQAITAEALARMFHETYERLAPSHGYETSKASAVPWDAVPEPNRSLMIAVAAEVLEAAAPHLAAAYEVTFATLRDLSDRTLAAPLGNYHSRGYRLAMQDVKAVLDKHDAPLDEPVHFGEQP